MRSSSFKTTEEVIEYAKSLGMMKVEYDDGIYYDLCFEFHSGLRLVNHDPDINCWILQFKEDISYAQIVNTSLDFKEISIDECLSSVVKIKEIVELTNLQ